MFNAIRDISNRYIYKSIRDIFEYINYIIYTYTLEIFLD